jgi:hypothetical protein
MKGVAHLQTVWAFKWTDERLDLKPVEPWRPRAAVQPYYGVIGMWRANRCRMAVLCGSVGLENRSLVLQAVPKRA